MIKENIKNQKETNSANTANWYLIDAKDKILGRLSSFLALRLMGKHKPNYNDNIWVTGCLGDSSIGLAIKKKKIKLN